MLRTYQLTDSLSWDKGSHRIRFGGEWEHHYGQGHWAFLEPAFATLWDPLHILQFVAGTGGPNVSPFWPLYNALPDSLKLNATATGPLRPGLLPTYQDILRLPLAGFATGVGDPGQPQQYNFDEAARNNRFRLFFADQWRVKSGFTLTYGLSWSFEDKLLNHDLDRPAILSTLLGGDLKPSRRDTNNFGPTLGFAWDVRGNGKTVVRGGGGIYHDSNLFWTRLNERAYIGPSGNGRYIIPGTIFILGHNGVINFDNFYEADDYQGADRTHKFTFSGFVDLPGYGGDNRFLRGLLNTWKAGLISQFQSKPALPVVVSGVDLDGDGNNTLILPGATYRNFGRGLGKDGVRALVERYNKTVANQLAGNGRDFKRTVRDQVIPTINLPSDFNHGDTFLSQDLRLTRVIGIREKVQLELIGEAFNIFNISNLAGYEGTLNATCPEFPTGCYGIASTRAGGVFGTGGPRAFQVAAKLTF